MSCQPAPAPPQVHLPTSAGEKGREKRKKPLTLAVSYQPTPAPSYTIDNRGFLSAKYRYFAKRNPRTALRAYTGVEQTETQS